MTVLSSKTGIPSLSTPYSELVIRCLARLDDAEEAVMKIRSMHTDIRSELTLLCSTEEQGNGHAPITQSFPIQAKSQSRPPPAATPPEVLQPLSLVDSIYLQMLPELDHPLKKFEAMPSLSGAVYARMKTQRELMPHRSSKLMTFVTCASTKVVKASASWTRKLFKTIGPIACLLPLCFLSLVWAVTSALSREPWGANDGPDALQCGGGMPICICPRETICATSWRSVVLLFLSRGSAYFDYPLYMILFLSKANNLRAFLCKTFLKELLPVSDMHEIHTKAGAIVGVEVMLHSLWHIIRWSFDGNIYLLTSHQTGITGLISLCCTPFIVGPMVLNCLKRRMSYEIRKALHYLSIVWGVSICFHAPKGYIFYLIGVPIVIYLVDYLVGFFTSLFHLRNIEITRLGSAIEMVWKNPPGFEHGGSGYVYICLPWVAKYQWHAFSIMSHNASTDYSAVCIATVGDWTRKINQQLSKPCSRPGWVYGPFPSPFSKASACDNIIAVASGIGITPAVDAALLLKSSRHVSIIWVCREPDLVEWFLEKVVFDHDAWTFVFYTGSRSLIVHAELLRRNPRVRIFSRRPDLHSTIMAIVRNVEDGVAFSEKLWANTVEMHRNICSYSTIEQLNNALWRALETYSEDELFVFACEASVKCNGHLDSQLHQVTLDGFHQFVKDICNPPEKLTVEEIDQFFQDCDSSGDGVIDKMEFLALITELGDRAQLIGSTPNKVSLASKELEISEDALLEKLTEQLRIDTWTITYCGGSASVINSLKEVAKTLGISLEVESFNW